MSEHPEIRELERRISVLERGRDPQSIAREAPIDVAMAVELERIRSELAQIDRSGTIEHRVIQFGRLFQGKNDIIRDLHCQIASKEAVIKRMEAHRNEQRKVIDSLIVQRNEAIAASTADNKEIAAPHRWQAEIDAWERGEPIKYRNLKAGGAWIMVPSKASLLQAHVATHSWDAPGEFRIVKSGEDPFPD